MDIVQGEDRKLTVVVKDDGVAVDISSATEIIVYLSSPNNNNTLLHRYSQSVIAGYGRTDFTTDGTDGSVDIFVNREESKSFLTGAYDIGVAVKVPNGSFPLNNTEVREWQFLSDGNVLAGIVKIDSNI